MAYRILVADDKPNMREMLASALADHGFEVAQASNGADAIAMMREVAYPIVITDLNMPGENGIGVLRAAKEIAPDTKVIIVTAYGTMETAVEAMRLGASDFIAKPFKIAEIELKVETLLRQTRNEAAKSPRTWMHPGVQQMVGTSEHTRNLLRMIAKIAPSKSAVLITGPTGTGKELVAKAIHDASPRRDRPYIALNCAALATGVLESELFGHEKGAFTGANERRVGRFERAHTGTLFLDEVGEIDPTIQTKLLRFLQEGEFERVGGTQTIKVDVRIVAATNRDLTFAIQQGRFREDFYYRLNVFSLTTEPLKNRVDDIPGLVDHFVRKYSLEMQKEINGIDDDVMMFFLHYSWPGNVRELENVIERATVLCEGPNITREDLPPELLFAEPELNLNTIPIRHAPAPIPEPPQETLSLVERTDQMEAEIIRGVLEKFHWNKSKAADHLGIKRTTLQYKVKKYGLD